MYNLVIVVCFVLDVWGIVICLVIDFVVINFKEILVRIFELNFVSKGRNEIINKIFLYFKIKCR